MVGVALNLAYDEFGEQRICRENGYIDVDNIF